MTAALDLLESEIGKQAHNAYEKSKFLEARLKKGLTIRQMAKESGLSFHEVEDYLELAAAPLSLGKLLNKSSLPVVYLTILFRRHQGWAQSAHAESADEVAASLLEMGERESLSLKSWRFYLDFYWSGQRPFMS